MGATPSGKSRPRVAVACLADHRASQGSGRMSSMRRGRRALLGTLLAAASSALAAQAFVLPGPGASSPLRPSTTSSRSSSSMARASRRLVPLGVTQGFPQGSEGGNRGQQQQQQQQQQSPSPSRPQHEAEEGLYFDWQHNWRVHYVQAGEKGKPPLLLCPGFGVGVEHYERNIGALAQEHHVFGLDYLGQGRSWPAGDIEPEHGLVLSIETWMDQIATFIRDVIQEPCYISGNSLGGFLATAIAATHPELVKGVVLLNSTPFWSFAPNRRRLSEWVKRTIIPYDGTLPAPKPLFAIGANWFNGLRNPATVKSMLSAVYADDRAWDDRTVQDILRPTEHRHGHAAFTSILFAPKPPHTFEEYLANVRVPILLLYGREDPWVTPSWGQKVKRQRPEVRYIEITPAGHCPHHEAPETVNTLISEWVAEVERAGGQLPAEAALPHHEKERIRVFREAVTGNEVQAVYQDGAPRDFVEWLVAATVLR